MPLSMFKTNGNPRIISNKADLMNLLKVEVSARSRKPDISILDGCAILWIIQWPSSTGTMTDHITSFSKYILNLLDKNDVLLAFDRYHDYSIKSVTREKRNVAQSSKSVKVTLNGPAQDKNVVLTNKNNKKQLIELLVRSLTALKMPKANRRLIVTGPDPVPIEVSYTGIRERNDLRTLHEEADTIIVSQMLSLVNEGFTSIQVICADTDVFVLLLHYFRKENLRQKQPPVDILMQSPLSSTKAISIRDTCDSLPPFLVSSLLAAHALSGCDTVPQMFGFAKKKVLNLLKSERGSEICLGLKDLGNIDVQIPWSTIEESGINFVRALFGQKETKSLSDIRYEKWMEKVKNEAMDSPSKLRYLPPTKDALGLNIKRAHFQCSIWKNVTLENAAQLRPEDFGWTKDTVNECLDPTPLPQDRAVAPDCLLSVTFCGCCSANPCSTQRCSCKKAQLQCTVLCKCQGNCCNGEATELERIDIDNNNTEDGDGHDDDESEDDEYDNGEYDNDEYDHVEYDTDEE